MKNTFFIFLLLLLTETGFAQTDKGKVMIGGNVSYYNNKSTYIYSQATINPSIGYFIKNNLALGSDITYTYSKSIYSAMNGINSYRVSNGIGISPFIRYYKFIGDKLAVYGQVTIGTLYSHAHYTENSSLPYMNTISGNAGFKPGLVYFLSKKFGFEVSAGSITYMYNHNYYENNKIVSSNNSTFNFNLGLKNLSLGAYFYL